METVEDFARYARSYSDLSSIGDGPVVLTNGCFDGLHLGHIKLLDFCARLGFCFVAVDSDENIRRLKGEGKPIWSVDARIQMIAALHFPMVGSRAIFSFHGDIENVVEGIKPDYLVKGEDWVGKVRGAEHAGQVIYFAHVDKGYYRGKEETT